MLHDGSWWSRRSHICVPMNWEVHWGVRQTTQPRVPAQEKEASKPLAVKTCGSFGGGRNS